jgi:hypothetical protein
MLVNIPCFVKVWRATYLNWSKVTRTRAPRQVEQLARDPRSSWALLTEWKWMLITDVNILETDERLQRRVTDPSPVSSKLLQLHADGPHFDTPDVLGQGSVGRGSRGFLTPLAASSDPLRGLLYKISVGNDYIHSVWTPPHTWTLRSEGAGLPDQAQDLSGPARGD